MSPIEQAGRSGWQSLSHNTVDADILEYILRKLRSRIETGTRTFLIKVKVHRVETMNEKEDDLTDLGGILDKDGED